MDRRLGADARHATRPWRAGIGAAHWVAVLAFGAAVGAGCAGTPVTHEVRWVLEFDTPARAAAAERIEVQILRGSCESGVEVWGMGPVVLTRDDGGVPTPPRLPAGAYCLRANAIDGTCVRFAGGSTAMTLGPGTSEVRLRLSPIEAERECPAYVCAAGRCAPERIDGGVPPDVPDVYFELPDSPLLFDVGPLPDAPPPDVGPPDSFAPLHRGCASATPLEPGFFLPPATALGAAHTCTIVGSRAYCWGADDDGQVGAGRVLSEVRVPIEVASAGSGTWTTIAAGDRHTCAIDGGGIAYCWGANDSGQLGIGSIDPSPHPLPTPVSGLPPVASIAAGRAHTCAAAMDGSGVWCWGANGNRQLGSAGGDSPTPRAFSALGTAGGVAAGGDVSCARRTDGAGTFELVCWGEPGPWLAGASGTGPATIGTSTFAACSTVSGRHACGCLVEPDGFTLALRCWGENDDGELGVGSIGAAVVVPTVVSAASIGGFFGVLGRPAAGSEFTCFTLARADGAPSIGCAGDGTSGATGPLGLGRDSPTPIAVLRDGHASYAGGRHACATTPLGLVCWGSNERGELGTGAAATSSAEPALVCF